MSLPAAGTPPAGPRPVVLALRALGLGDLLAGVPALRALRRAHPGGTLLLAVPEGLHGLVRAAGLADDAVHAAPLAPLDPPPRVDLAVNLHGRGPQSHRVLQALPGRPPILAFASPEAGVDGPEWREDEHERDRWCRMLAWHGIPADPGDLRIRLEGGGDPFANWQRPRPIGTAGIPGEAAAGEATANWQRPRPTGQPGDPGETGTGEATANWQRPRPTGQPEDPGNTPAGEAIANWQRPRPTGQPEDPGNTPAGEATANWPRPRPTGQGQALGRTPATGGREGVPGDEDLPRRRAGPVVVHPGASTRARRWPADGFARVAAELAARGASVVVTGSADERGLAAEVARRAGLPPGAVLAGRTDPVGLAHLVAAAALVVSGDTGIAHLAVALGTPSVTVFGPTPPERWGPPADPRHRVLWAGIPGPPDGDAPGPGLRAVTAEAVAVTAQAVLDEGLPLSR